MHRTIQNKKGFRLMRNTLLISVAFQILLFYRIKSAVWDEGLVTPWFISKGLVPYRDFSMGQYLPFPKILMLGINSLFHWNIYITIYLALVLSIVTLYLIYYLSRKYLGPLATMASLTFYSIFSAYLLQQNTFEITLFVSLTTLISLCFYLENINKHSVTKIFFLGLFLSMGVFSHQIAIVPYFIFFIMTLLKRFKEKVALRNIIKFTIIPFVIGSLILPIPILIWILKLGVFPNMFYETVTYYIGGGGYPFNHSFEPNYMLMLAAIYVPSIILIALTIKGIKINRLKIINKQSILWVTLPLILIVTAYLIITLTAVVHPRRFLLQLPFLSLMSGMIFHINIIKNKSVRIINILMIIYILGYGFFNVLPWYIKSLYQGRKQPIYNIHYEDQDEYKAIQWIKENTSPSERIFSFETTIAYFEAQRLPAINRTYILPWNFEPFDEMEKLWNNNPPEYCLVSELMFERFGNLGYSNQIQFLRKSLDTNYLKKAVFGYMTIYIRRPEKIGQNKPI